MLSHYDTLGAVAERAASSLTTFPYGRNARLPGISAGEQALEGDLLKLRAVLILLGARHGFKVATARSLAGELRAIGLKASPRSIYFWRRRYLVFGFAGIRWRRRDDTGCPRRLGQETFARIVDAATRVKRYGDLACEFRKLRLGISRETFRTWIWRIRRQLKVVEMPPRRGGVR
jgi:hypothetical protein